MLKAHSEKREYRHKKEEISCCLTGGRDGGTSTLPINLKNKNKNTGTVGAAM